MDGVRVVPADWVGSSLFAKEHAATSVPLMAMTRRCNGLRRSLPAEARDLGCHYDADAVAAPGRSQQLPLRRKVSGPHAVASSITSGTVGGASLCKPFAVKAFSLKA
jgi:hypothetical protein